MVSEVQCIVGQLNSSGPEVRQNIMAEGMAEKRSSGHDHQEAESEDHQLHRDKV